MCKLFGTMLLLPIIVMADSIKMDYPPIPVPDKAFAAPLATKAMLLDGVFVDGRVVVVGEHGIILISDDEGHTWRQTISPTRSTLTGVHFYDKNTGWVVGHDAIILRTVDGGGSWERVHYEPELQQPLFDVWFANKKRGIAIGAYGLFLVTSDGGSTWEATDLVPEPWPDLASISSDDDSGDDEFDFEDDQYFDFHLNAIASAKTGDLYIAAETGNFFRSGDDGETWFSMPEVYEGSYFGVLPLQGQNLILMGLRGNMFSSINGGEAFSEIDSPVTVLLNGGALLDDGTIFIGGMAGALLESKDGGQTFELLQQPDRKAISIVLPVSDALILIGEAGVRRVALSQLKGDQS